MAIQNDCREATWLSVNTDGCFVEVALREKLFPHRRWLTIGNGPILWPPGREPLCPWRRNEAGRKCGLGETVEAGQLLIAGLYEQEVDPYSPPPEEPYQILGAARGSVRALTYREFTVEVPQEESELGLREGGQSTMLW